MWRFLKWLLLIVLILIVLIVIGFVVLVNVINPNDYKGKIETAFKQSTGRTLSIPGKISWSLFPDIGFKLGKISINNPKGFPQTPFASINLATVSLELMPLLSKEVAVNTLSLQGVQIDLVQLSKTSNNWTFAQEKSLPAKAPATGNPSQHKGTTSEPKHSTSSAMMQFSMDKLDISNAMVSYDDRVTGQKYTVNLDHLTANNVEQGVFFPISMQATITQAKPALTMNTSLNASVKLDTNSFTVKNLVATLDQSKLIGQLSVVNFNDPLLKLSLSLNQIDAAKYLLLKDTVMSLKNANLKLEVDGNQQAQDSVVKTFSLNADQMQYLANKQKYAVKDMRLSASNIQMRKAFPLNFSGQATLPQARVPLKMNMNSRLYLDPGKQVAKIDSLSAQINQSKLWGSASINGFVSSHMVAHFSLNQIDAADFANLQGARLPMSGIKFSVNLNTQGFDAKHMPSTLNGTFSADVNKAVLKGVDVGELLASLRNVIKSLIGKHNVGGALTELQKSLPQYTGKGKQKQINPNNGKETDIGRFILASKITNGVVANDNIQLTGARFRMKGSGQADLNKKTLNYLVYAYGTHFVNQNGKRVEVDDTVQLPIKIKGPFADVRTGIDMPKLSRSVQKAVVQSVASQYKQKAVDEVKKQSHKLLESLFGK